MILRPTYIIDCDASPIIKFGCVPIMFNQAIGIVLFQKNIKDVICL